MSSHGFSAPSGKSGGSLYGGILAKAAEPAPAAQDASTSEATQAPAKAEDKSKAWSASLGFAPVLRKRPTVAKTATPAALSTSYNVATIVAAPQLINVPCATLAAEPLASSSSAKPPALTLPEAAPGEDVNGFRQTAAGKRAASDKKSKRKKKKRNEEETMRDYTAEYDPARPNDYAEWKSYVKFRKAEEREARRRELEAEDEEYSSASEDERRPVTQDRRFAPPTAFYAGAEEAPRPESPPYQAREDSPPYQSITPPPPPARSPPRPRSPPPDLPQSGEDAYARRMAMSTQSGDDAYARRAALSAQAAQPSQPPEQPAQAVNIDEAAARARAIAERLGKMAASMPPAPPAPVQTQPPSPPAAQQQPMQYEEYRRPNPHAFAANLMAKYGWKQGQGLGASESGMLNPLTVAQAESAGKKPKESEGKVPVGFSTSRNTIVSDSRSAKEQAEKAKYGEPSRIILLRNVVGRKEVDDDLATEIGEEAGKHGFVERCKVHLMPFNVPDDQSVRIFVIFSGLVGAWKAVKELDGRHFGGRTVRATFFDEAFFERNAFGIDC